MNDIGIPQQLIDLIGDIYYKSSTRIMAKKSKPGEIRTKKGVKYGCPLSRLLFDLAIDPLLKDVEVMHAKEGYRMQVVSENVSTSIQAYADDILLFSESKEKMHQIRETVQMLGEYANIRLNPKKCQAFYLQEKNESRDFEQEKINVYGEELTYVKINEVIKYLGIPIGARKKPKMNFAEKNIEKFRKHLRRITLSGLKISQEINAIKIFILFSIGLLSNEW
jgi:hypothetical protein